MLRKNHKIPNIGMIGLAVLTLLMTRRPAQVSAMPSSLSLAPGSLDPTFGSNGRTTTDFGSSSDVGKSVIVQPDGKLIVAGYIYFYGGPLPGGFALARYNADGSPDPTFGIRGRVTGLNVGDVQGAAAVLQPDGKIILSSGRSRTLTLARYNSDGSPDLSFGSQGVVITSLAPYVNIVSSLALQPDGRMIVAATIGANTTSNDILLARYNRDGSLDPTFDGDGKTIADFGAAEQVNSIALQPDGRIVLAGDLGGDLLLARYNSDGSLDSSFNGDGKVISDLGGTESGSAVTLQTDGRILVAGTSGYNEDSDYLLARYESNGALDTTFGAGGKVLTDWGSRDEASAVSVQPDGRIVVSGSSWNGYSYVFGLARYMTGGSLDASFDGDGKVQTAEGNYGGCGIALQADGRIVATGSDFNGVNSDFAVVRYNTDGSLDPAFGIDGRVATDFGVGSGDEQGYAVALQPDGRIVVAGQNDGGDVYTNFALARYNTDGSPDLTFGDGGKVTTDFTNETFRSYHNTARAVAIQADGKILAAGSSVGSSGTGFVSRFALVCYNTDGTLDKTFSADGKVTTTFDGGSGQGWAAVLQPDGRILVAGDTGYPYTTDCCSSFALARYNADGSPDPTFGGDGKVTTSFEVDSLASVRGMALQPDGKILVAGFDSNSSFSSFALARYNKDGSLDTTFGNDGKVTTSFAEGGDSQAYDLALQPDGRIVVAGSSLDGGSQDVALARYNANGSLDPTFGSGGRLTSDFGSANEQGWAVALQPDGRIVAAGQSSGALVLARYRSSGAPDTAFGTDGKVITDIGTDLSGDLDLPVMGGDLVLQPNGKIVMAGGTTINETQDFALARFVGETVIDLPGDWVGSVHVTSDRNIVTVGRPHIGAEVASYGGVADGSLTSYVPMLFRKAYGAYNAALYVQNGSTAQAAITIRYYDGDGNLKCTKNDTLAALSSKGYWLPAETCTTGSLDDGWVGGAVVTSDQPIVAVGRPHIGGEVMTYNGFTAMDVSLTSYLPMLFKGAYGGSYQAAFYVQNTNASTPASITIRFYDSNGLLKCTKADTIQPFASKGYWVPSITCDSGSLPDGWVGGAVVTSDQPVVTVGRPSMGSQVTTYNGFTGIGPGSSTYIPMLFKKAWGSYNSAFYLQNTHATNTANVTIRFYDSAGNLSCTKMDRIAPLASKGYWVPAETCDTGSLPDGWVGGVIVTSDQPVVGVGRPHIGTQVTTYDGFTGGFSTSDLPMLFKAAFDGSYNAAFYIQNTENSSAAVIVQFRDTYGSLTCTLTDTIQPLATLGYWLPDLTCNP
jgi:uncharacterized delta-60 repeat protein